MLCGWNRMQSKYQDRLSIHTFLQTSPQPHIQPAQALDSQEVEACASSGPCHRHASKLCVLLAVTGKLESYGKGVTLICLLQESMPKDPSRVSLGPAHKETFHKVCTPLITSLARGMSHACSFRDNSRPQQPALPRDALRRLRLHGHCCPSPGMLHDWK